MTNPLKKVSKLLLIGIFSSFTNITEAQYLKQDGLTAMQRLDSLAASMYYQQYTKADSVNLNKYINLTEAELPKLSEADYIDRLSKIPSAIPLQYNGAVKDFIEMFTVRKRMYAARTLGNSEVFFPYFEEALDKHKMPHELKYLVIVESAFNPNAVSPAGATGLWQIMYGTGKYLGLEINSYVDERRDPKKSTDAALKYLKQLHGIYGDWLLAIAAYNCGPGNVNKAITRSGGLKDYWSISPYLPRETRSYVPMFIAAAYTMNYADEHKIYPAPPVVNPFVVDTVHINNKTSLKFVADNIGVEEAYLKYLNPSLKTGIIPSLQGGFVLNIPIENVSRFAAKERIIANDTTINRYEVNVSNQSVVSNVSYKTNGYSTKKIYHKVRKGETLSKIAVKYGVSQADIKKWNRLKSTKVMLGQSLVIYKKTPIYKKSEPAVVVTDNIDTTDLASKVAQGEDVSDQDADTEVETETEVAVASVTPGTVKQTVMVNKYHVVKKGESLGLIANKYNTSVPNIKTYNKLAKNTVYPGQKLIVGKKAVVKEIKSPVKETTDGLVHVVKQGESISGLALKYGCTSNEIREWNSLKSSALSVGQKLNIRTNPESKLKEADYVYHKIQQGDTLWSIAQKYGSSVDEIKKINNIANSNELHPGEVLKVTK